MNCKNPAGNMGVMVQNNLFMDHLYSAYYRSAQLLVS